MGVLALAFVLTREPEPKEPSLSPIALLGVFLVLAALLHLWWLPLMRERWHTLETRAKAARAGLLVVAEKLRTLAVLGACAMLLVLGLVAASGWLAGTDAAWPKAVIGAMALAQAAAAAIGKEYGAWLGVLGLAGAALSLWAAARAARRRVEAAWMERASQVHDELRADPAVDRRKSVPNARENVSIQDSTHARRFRSQGLARPAAGCEARVSIAQPCRRQRSKSVNGVVADKAAFARRPSGLATPARDRLPQISRWRPRCEATART